MSFYYKVSTKCDSESEENFEEGEFQTYDNNIRQKSKDSPYLKFKFNGNIVEFSNFGYSTDGRKFVYIYQQRYLVIYDMKKLQTFGIFDLPIEIQENINNYVCHEKRNFFQKVFSRMSFLTLKWSTNNIFVNNLGNLICLSSSIFL